MRPWINENFKFDVDLKFVELKIAYVVSILNKLKCYFPNEILLQHHNALIYPHLLYKYGVLLTNLTCKISILRNKAVKIVTHTKWDSCAKPSYTNLMALKLNKLYQFEVAKIMFNLFHKQHPYNLNQYFTKSNIRHYYPPALPPLTFTNPPMQSTKL